MAELTVHPEKGDRFKFPLPNREITIGRLPVNDLHVRDGWCSGRHAAIAPSKGEFLIRDLGSKNGTILNGIRLSGERALKHGDEIRVGNSRLRFEDHKTEVTITRDTDFTQSSNTLIPVREIVTKHRSGTSGSLREDRSGEHGLETRRDKRISLILRKMGEALILHMEVDELCEYIMNLVSRDIPMDWGALLLKGDGEELVQKSVRVFDESSPPDSFQISQSVVQEVLDKNVSILISDVQADQALPGRESMIAKAIHSAVCVPLWDNTENDEKIIGLIYADRRKIRGPFTQDEADVLTLLANMAAVKISNARLIDERIKMRVIEQQLVLAREIQKNLLPKADPVFEPYDISGTMRPCFEVGGDYFDYISLGRRLGLVVADVSGKGFSAAMHMTQLRGHLYGLFSEETDLGALVAGLNEFIHSCTEIGAFISFFFGLLDRETGEFTYANAGHNPPLLVGAGSAVRRLSGTGFCLGMFPSVHFGTETVKIAEGDILCLYTDGIVEVRNSAQEDYGEERLAALIRENAGTSARAIMDRILESVCAFSSCPDAHDDMTLVIVKDSGPGSGPGLDRALGGQRKQDQIRDQDENGA